MTAGSKPPHSLEAEQALLGCALLNAGAMARAAEVISCNDLYRDEHRVIFGTMLALYRRDEAVDLVTVVHELGPLLEKAGGPAFIAGLADGIPTTAAMASYIRIVREKSEQRQWLALADEIKARCMKGEDLGDIAEFIRHTTAKQPKPGGAKAKFHFIPACEVVASQERTKWLINGYSEQGTTGSIFGPPECFKSFIGLDMGLCVSADIPWHGRAVTPGPVLYLCGEGQAGIGRRIEAWSRSHNVTAAKFFVSNIAAALLDGESVNAVLAAANEVKENCGPPVLIIIDTLNRNFGPGDENSTQDMTGFVAAIDRLRIALKCAVLIIHHSGVVNTERARGSSALRGALDFEYQVSRTDGDTIAETAVEFRAVKTKDHDRPPTITFRPVVVDLGRVDEDGNPITSLTMEPGETTNRRPVRKLSGALRIALESLKVVTCDDGMAHIDTWRQECYRRSVSTSDKQGAKQKAFTRASQSLLDRRLVETKDDFFWLAGQPDKTGQKQTLSGVVLAASQTDRTHTLNSVSVVRADNVSDDSEMDVVDEGVFL